MATDLVSVTFKNHWRDRRDPDPEKHRDYKPGDTDAFDADLARRFVRAGTADYTADATKKTETKP